MKTKKVLVIDDDEMNLQIAKMVLERKLSCKVLIAAGGLDGLDVLQREHVDLVLLDIMMPDFDGIETLQEIRGDARTKDLPVMMLTASGDLDDIQKVGALGVKDYIKKPFLPADLIARVGKKLAEVRSEVVLIIGDDESALQSMRDVVEKNFPHEVLTAATYADTVKILRESDVSLIVACADMNFLDGFKILAFVAADEKFSAIPFAVTTADKLLEVVDKINSPSTVEPPAKKIDPPIVAQNSASVESHSEKKKLANVVTTLIGYELDVHV